MIYLNLWICPFESSEKCWRQQAGEQAHIWSWVDGECGELGRVAGVGASGPFMALPEVPGLNADSLRVIKSSLS